MEEKRNNNGKYFPFIRYTNIGNKIGKSWSWQGHR